VKLNQRLDNAKVVSGGRTIYGNIMLPERKRSTQFVAVSTGDPLDPVWYGQLVLCFVAVYLGQKAGFCYVRWLGRVQKVAQAAGRSLDPADTRFPFNTYRWDLHPGMRGFRGHPKRPVSLTTAW